MNKSTIHKLLLTRRLYELARENLNSSNDLSLSIGVNLLQDAVEVFLLAVSELVNASILPTTKFEQYFDLINAKISPKELPFRSRLSALNKLRVNSKHYGLAPAESETKGILITAREFFDEVTQTVMGLSFATISLIDLLHDGAAKEFLKIAEAAFIQEDYKECLIACRKAIFVRFEYQYDVAPYASDEPPKGLGLSLIGSKAPYFARNKEYIEKNVNEPTDYIVLDHKDLEMELLTSRIDSVSFWNVWRLTPEVYRLRGSDDWVVKWEFNKLDNDGIKGRAEYVLDTTISLFVAADQRTAATRMPDYRKYYVDLNSEEVPIYAKADKRSNVIGTTPPGQRRLYVNYRVAALDGSETFWHVSHFDEGCSVWGFISEDSIAD